MATIRVKLGGCGIKYTDAHGNARHALKTPESGPFECDDAQAARLVELGVAEYVAAKAAAPAPLTDAQGHEDSGEPSQENTEKATGHLDAEQLEAMEYNELKKLAAEMGVKPKSQKKEDYIAAIVAVEVELGDEVDPDEEDPDNELPELNAADPE